MAYFILQELVFFMRAGFCFFIFTNNEKKVVIPSNPHRTHGLVFGLLFV